MSVINEKIIRELYSASTGDSVNWEKFDDILDSIDDINAFDDKNDEETYLLCCIEHSDYHAGENLAEIIRRFLIKGYDVKANDGKNGGRCLSQLCWSTYDSYIVDAAKVLLSAGAPIEYQLADDAPDEPTGIMGDIGWKLPGAWVVDKDYSWANIMETYYQLVKAVEEGRAFSGISTYHNCIGKKLKKVELCGNVKLQPLGKNTTGFDNSLVFWFDDLPLIASKYIEFVINPNVVEEYRDNLTDCEDAFSDVIDAELEKVSYINQSTCFFDFSNGRRLIFTSVDAGEKGRTGLFEIARGGQIELSQLDFDAIAKWNNHTYAEHVTEYNEEVLAFIKNDVVTLVYTNELDNCGYFIDSICCSIDLAKEYDQILSFDNYENIKLFNYDGMLKAIRIKCGDKYLYAQAHEYKGLEIKLSLDEVSIDEPTLLRRLSGIHMNFLARK